MCIKLTFICATYRTCEGAPWGWNASDAVRVSLQIYTLIAIEMSLAIVRFDQSKSLESSDNLILHWIALSPSLGA